MKPVTCCWLRLLAAACFLSGMTLARVEAAEVVLQDEWWTVAFDQQTGALTRMESKTTHWTMERRPELGVSFRLHAPLPDRRDNFVLGSKQRAAQVKLISPRQAAFRWENPVSEHGGVVPLVFTSTVTLSNGDMIFNAALENKSSLMIETLDYPWLGDLTAPDPSGWMRSRHQWYGDMQSEELYPAFGNGKGYWGVDYPTRTIQSKQTLYCLIQGPAQGLYVGMHDPTQPYLLEFTFEQRPGALDSVHADVPRNGEVGGLPSHLVFRTCHFLFAHPHSTTALAPVVLHAYEGDWHAGVDVYKQWRKTWFKPHSMPAWALDVHSWDMLQVNSPEQEYRVPYTNLIRYGEECASNGVAAIQVVGWNIGGQDGGDPCQDTDPGLGTWQELHDAIAQIQAKGVKVILFAKLNWADKTTAWYSNELYRYETRDPYGIPYEMVGYSYHTPTQLAAINNRRRSIMDTLCPAYRDVAAKEFQKILALGSAGWQWDEVSGHSVGLYNFASGHGYTPPGFIFKGDLPLTSRLREIADKTNPDFLFSGEAPQEWLIPYYLSYFRITASSTPICRYLDPRAPLMVTVSGFDDREMLNLVLLNRYIINYEPYYLKGHLTDFPLTLAYGQKMDALRRRYRAWLWDADFQDTLGATVTADGPRRYSVFVAPTGKRAVIVVNDTFDKSITAKVALPNPGTLAVATPEAPEARTTTGEVTIPARSAAVVMEQ